jgi:His-Xaa-Ser system radical SAM maturase HxsC
MPSHPADAALIRLPQDVPAARLSGFATALVVNDSIQIENDTPPEVAVVANRFDYLSDGDVLGFQPTNGRFRTLYRKASAHNSFLVTERCNHYCLMCSQPPRDIDDRWVLDQIKAAVELVDPQTRSFAFTGGEPLLEWRSFIELLEHCRKMLPSTSIHVLTNGRGFARGEITAAWASVDHPKLMAGIPIYSAVDHIHDYVVQAKGAFDETVLGILKLKDKGQRVEVRVVLHAITAPRIVETCRWLARNLPFVDHVALMGLENTGFALANSGLLWIDPVDYKVDLEEAVSLLASAKVPVSIYNLPRCVLARSIWPYAVQSISDWKNGYAEVCVECIERPHCAGFFTSGRPRQSRGISPISVDLRERISWRT